MFRQLFVFLFCLIFVFGALGKQLTAQAPHGTPSPSPAPSTPGSLPPISFEEPTVQGPSSPSAMPFGPWELDWHRYQHSKIYDPQWDSLVKEGIRAYGEGHMEAAYTFLSQAVDGGCRDGIVFYYLAKQQEAVNNIEASIRYFILAWIVIADQYPDLHYRAKISSQLGIFFFTQGRFDKTIQFCKPIVDQYPGEIQLTYLIAVSYYQLGQFLYALQYFDRIIDSHQNYQQSRQLASLASLEIARVYCSRNLINECQEYLYKALFFEPNNQMAKAMLAQLAAQQQQGGQPTGDADRMLLDLMKK